MHLDSITHKIKINIKNTMVLLQVIQRVCRHKKFSFKAIISKRVRVLKTCRTILNAQCKKLAFKFNYSFYSGLVYIHIFNSIIYIIQNSLMVLKYLLLSTYYIQRFKFGQKLKNFLNGLIFKIFSYNSFSFASKHVQVKNLEFDTFW